jgi:hypothetical protein
MTVYTKLQILILSLISFQTYTDIKHNIKTTADIVCSATTRASSNTLFNVALDFDAATAGDSLSVIGIPQNLNGWIGQEQYILMSYGAIRSFNKTTGLRDNVLNIDSDSFFNTASGDVRIDYDRFAQRWITYCEAIDGDGNLTDLVICISADAVITPYTRWYTYTIPASVVNPGNPNGTFDYGQLAVDQNAIYIGINAFSDPDGTVFVGSSAVVIQKSSVINGGTAVYTVFPGLLGNINSQYLPPADNFTPNPTYGYFINAVVNYNNNPPTGSDQLALYRISNPGSATPSITGPIFITVPSFGYADIAPHLGNLFGNLGYLQSGNALMWAPHVRGNYLFCAHDIQVNQQGVGMDIGDGGDRIAVRWYQFDLTAGGVEAPNTVPTLVQSGTLFDNAASDPKYYFNASIMTNKNLDLVISSTVSGNLDYTNVIYAARKATDPLGTLRDPVYITQAANSYNFGPLAEINVGALLGQRWGDASSLSPDPINDLDLWNTQEYATINNSWAINVSKLVPVS